MLGGAAGPWVTGLLYDATGNYTLAFCIAIGSSGLSALAIWLVCAGIGLLFLARGAFQPYIFPLFENLGGLSYGQIALLLNGYVLAQSVGAPLASIHRSADQPLQQRVTLEHSFHVALSAEDLDAS